MNVIDALNCRKSIRSYNGAITDDELSLLLKAAQASPIGRALYDTVKITVITDPGLLEEISRNAAEFFGDPGAQPLYGAPTLIMLSTKLAGNPGDNVAYSNAAIVVENMALEAVEIGVAVCHIWGASIAMSLKPELVKKLGLPEGFVPVCALAAGKSDEKYEPREIPDDRIAVNYI